MTYKVTGHFTEIFIENMVKHAKVCMGYITNYS